MKKYVSALSIFLLLALPATTLTAKTKSALSVPVTGTFTDAAGLGKFEGTFNIVRFEAVGEEALLAHGYLTGTLTSATGTSLGTVMKSVAWPVDLAASGGASSMAKMATGRNITTSAVCDVLSLVLGPLDLDLLGLTVHLDRVVLDIDAVSGGGALLGNLLCAVVGLLDPLGSLVEIANLLNQILDILGELLP